LNRQTSQQLLPQTAQQYTMAAVLVHLLYAIKPLLCTKRYTNGTSRRDLTVITRLSIGHTRVTHSYLLTTRDTPHECSYCHVTLTVKHFLLKCPFLSVERSMYFCAASLKDLFERVYPGAIIIFLKDIHYYDHIVWFYHILYIFFWFIWKYLSLYALNVCFHLDFIHCCLLYRSSCFYLLMAHNGLYCADVPL